VLAHLRWKNVRKNTKHATSHLKKAGTTWGGMWSARTIGLKATAARSKVILITPGMTTTWSRNLRPYTLRHCPLRPSIAPLNKRHMYAMGRAVHVLVIQLVLSPLISLPPKAKLNKMTIPMAIVTVISYFSLRWLLAHFLVGMCHSW
jgi:hypothetical protein